MKLTLQLFLDLQSFQCFTRCSTPCSQGFSASYGCSPYSVSPPTAQRSHILKHRVLQEPSVLRFWGISLNPLKTGTAKPSQLPKHPCPILGPPVPPAGRQQAAQSSCHNNSTPLLQLVCSLYNHSN